ncbi:MAG: hypothetical protein OHK0039_03110 [Bacteroidia bacterium]
MILRKPLILTLLMLASWGVALAQPCTPDTTLNVVGLYPDSLPTGYVGQPYYQVVQAVLPTDTSIAGFQLSFCSYRIVNTTPDVGALGLSYECDEPGCNYFVDHGAGDTIVRGCLVISGTPTDTVESILVNLEAQIGTYLSALDSCIISTQLVLPYAVDFVILDTTSGDTTTSIYAALQARDLDLRLAPNPSNGSSQLQFRLPVAAHTEVAVYDMVGRRVQLAQQGYLLPGRHDVTLEAGSLPEGIYLVRMHIDGQVFAQKWNLRR